MGQGFLMKRGFINTSFQSRWFILSSDMKLRYYKFENGQCQGSIDVATVSNIQYTDEGTDTLFSLLGMHRTWTLQAQTMNEKSTWIDVIVTLLEENGGVNVREVVTPEAMKK